MAFGAEIPAPSDRLFEVVEKIREKKLFKATPFYLPRYTLSADSQYPGLKVLPSFWFSQQIREGRIAESADLLPGRWIILDVSKRPNYGDGKQMYTDSNGLGEVLADLRDQGKIEVPYYCRKVPRNSRFAVSADEIDGKSGVVVKAVASILSLRTEEQIATLPYVVFNYIGNLAHPEFGQVSTAEWFADRFEHGDRLSGGDGDSVRGGLARVSRWLSDDHIDGIGFRLQVSFPSKA
ncbi:MAG: hypothetical protein Q7R44_00430 [bacterium]|nr:hypothetical protein [bacterium]